MFAGVFGSGIISSTNYGNNWIPVNNGLSNNLVLCLNTLDPFIFAGTWNYGGFYRSSNNGYNWNIFNNGLSYQIIQSIGIIDNSIFAGVYDEGIFKSTNNGQDWLFTGIEGYYRTFTTLNNKLYAGPSNEVFYTENSGINWNQLPNSPISVFSLANDSSNLFAGCSNGAYKSSNGGVNWIFLGLYDLDTSGWAFIDNLVLLGFKDGVLLSSDGGINWLSINEGLTTEDRNVGSILLLNSYMFIGTKNQKIFRRDINNYPLLNHKISGTVKYSDNNQPVSGGYVKALKLNYSNMQMETIDSTGIQSNGTYSLPNVRTDSVYIRPYPNSTTTVDFIPTYYPSSITWENATVLYVTSNLNNIDVGVVRVNISSTSSTISGNVFKTTYNPLPGLKDVLLYVKFNNEIKGFAFSNNEGYYLLNNMPTGSYKVYANRPGYKSDSVTVNMPSGGTLTNINYTLYPVWTSFKKLESGIVTEYRLEQNYPNPFNSKTKIKFDVKKPGNVKLKVFDITGKLVADIINNELETGRYEVLFDAKNLSSSIYFYRMETGEFVKTKRMIHVK